MDLNEAKSNFNIEELEKVFYNTASLMQVLNLHEKKMNEMLGKIKFSAANYYKKVFQGERVVVFDCGYSGSISDCLMKSIPGIKVDKIYLWEKKANVNLDKKNGTKTFIVLGGKKPGWLDVIVETFFSPLEGSCIGFNKKGENAVPIFDQDDLPDTTKQLILRSQSEIIDFASYFDEIRSSIPLSFNLKQGSMQIFSNIAYALIHNKRKNQEIFKDVIFKDSYMNIHKSYSLYEIVRKFDKKSRLINEIILRIKHKIIR